MEIDYMQLLKGYCNELGKELGKGYAECVYQEALCVLLRNAGIIYSKEVILPIKFRGVSIGNVRSDIILEDLKIIIELKAIDGNLKLSHVPQLTSYLNLTGYSEGILVNFNQNPSKQLVEFYHVKQSESSDTFIVNDEFTLSKNGIIQEESTE